MRTQEDHSTGARGRRARARPRSPPAAATTTATSDATATAAPRRPTSGVWLNGTDTPQAARDWLKTTFEDEQPGLHADHRAAGVGRPGREADHLAVQRLRDPRRRRGRQHPGADVHLGRRVQRRERRARRPRRRRPAPGLRRGRAGRRQDLRRAVLRRARSTSSTARTSSRRPASRCPTTHGRVRRRPAIDLKKANPKPANFSGFWFPGQDWRNGASPSSGTPAATSPSRTATSGRARCPRPSRSRAWRRSSS